MKVVIAGGSGSLGSALAARLTAGGHVVTVLTRHEQPGLASADVRFAPWQPDGTSGAWAHEIDGADAVVNLAGAGIADRRWTRARKEMLRSSRVLSTRSLVSAVRSVAVRPSAFVQASAVGYYGTDAGDRELDESFPPGADFFGRLGVAWEAEAHAATALGCRLVIVRSGVVLSRSGGALPKMGLPFRFFVGGPIASGRQYLSWIHIDDWTSLVIWALSSPAVSGVVNATAPFPVTNEEFSRTLGRVLRRPSWLRVPAFALRLLVGEMADPALIEGQRVVPRRATELGFKFSYPTLDEALTSVLKS